MQLCSTIETPQSSSSQSSCQSGEDKNVIFLFFLFIAFANAAFQLFLVTDLHPLFQKNFSGNLMHFFSSINVLMKLTHMHIAYGRELFNTELDHSISK